jgi:hypothetical protein
MRNPSPIGLDAGAWGAAKTEEEGTSPSEGMTISVIKMATRHDLTGPVILEIAGNFCGNCLGKLRRQLGKARRMNKPILIDLGEVTLVDPDSVHFLAEQTRENVRLINCPEYIEPWIHRELSNDQA